LCTTTTTSDNFRHRYAITTHLAEHVIQQRFTQQHAVSHVLDHRLLAGAVLETDGVANL
jgi:hypothetical protein